MTTKKKNLGGRPRTRPLPKAFDRMVGARIRVRRTILELSPAEFGKKIKRSLSQVYRVECGQTPVRGELFPVIAKVLGCSVSDLVDGVKAKP